MKKKTLSMLIALILVLCCAVGGTLAWLTDKTETVTNTFTIGDINIELDENTGDEYKMVPGAEITKDPFATVKAGSEACWLFVKVEKSDNYDTFLTFEIADGWTELQDGVYYREVADLTAEGAGDVVYPVIKNNTVNVNGDVTKEMLTASDFKNPTLAFTAYAVQKASFDTPAAAWAEASK